MLVQSIIDKLSNNTDISKGFKTEELIEYFNENQIKNYISTLLDSEVIFEEEGIYYFNSELPEGITIPINKVNENLEINSVIEDSEDEMSVGDSNSDVESEYLSSEDNSNETKNIKNKFLDKTKTLDEFNGVMDNNSKSYQEHEKSKGLKSTVQEKLVDIKDETRYWIHKTEFSILEEVHDLNQIGSEKPKSKIIKEVKPGDYILLIVNNRRHLDFFGLTKVEEVIDSFKRDNSDFYKYYKSDIQLKLKSIRYFNNPIIGNDISDELSFIEKNKTISKSLTTDYKEIPKEDFNSIIKHGHFVKSYPAYFDIVNLNLKEFIMNCIVYLYEDIKNKQKSDLIEIKVFLHKLTDFLNKLGVKKDYDYIVEFYSWNAIELEFTHVPYRDPDKAIPLYDTRGKKKEYAYIDLK